MLANLATRGFHLMLLNGASMKGIKSCTPLPWQSVAIVALLSFQGCSRPPPCPASDQRYRPSVGLQNCNPPNTSRRVANCPSGGDAADGEVIVACWVGGFCAEEYLGGDAGCNYCVREEEWDAWIAASCPDCREECVFEDGLGGYLCWVVCDASGTK